MIEALYVIVNCCTLGSYLDQRHIFQQDSGLVIEVLIQKGLKLKNFSLVQDIVQSLIFLLKTDESFNCIGQDGSVTRKMKECNAQMYFATLKYHDNEKVF